MIDEDIKKLDEIAKKMEAGDLALEKTLELFNEGIQLVRKCSKTLQDAELRVKEIIESTSGELVEKPL
ncbi:MAG: exodeoxyribonuclease VII small subunit [Bdellovibrionales bacterium]|nr:exodeoxyribonuclease VII small subunit [Bdellovibrionales bacterium]